MNQFVLFVSRFILVCLISIVVILAVMVGLGRQAITHLDEFKPEIEAYLKENTGLVFKIAELGGSWKKLSPRLVIHQLSVSDSETTSSFLSLDALTIEIDLGESFFYLRPVIELWVDGVVVELLYENGKFSVKHAPSFAEGDESSGEESDFLEQLDLIFKQPSLQLTNSDIVIKNFWASDVSVSNINVGMVSKGGNKRFWANLVLQGQSAIEAVVVGDLTGQFSRPGSLNGRVYTRVDAPDLADWMPLPARELTALEVIEASGQIQFWGSVGSGKIDRVTTQLSVADVLIKHEQSDQAAPRLGSVVALGKWEGNWNRDWVLGLSELSVKGENFEWSPQQLFLKSNRISNKERRLVGELDQASVAPWLSYYTSFLSEESKTYQVLKAINPEAQLDNVIFDIELLDEAVADFKVAADVTVTQTYPRRWIPGINNVKASILLGKNLSIIDIVGTDIDLNYPALFRENLRVDHVRGSLLIKNSDDQVVIESGLLEAVDEQVKGVTQLAVIIDKTMDKSPYLRLQATLEEFDVEDLHEHLPVGVIPDGIVRWLDSSIKAGQLVRGDLLFHGPTNLYEFEPFQYVLGFTVDETQLQFLPDWKPVNDVAADVRVYSGAVDAWAVSGEYYDNYVSQAWVGTKRVAPGAIDLIVDVDVNGRVEDALQILVDSPIAETTGAMLDEFTATGEAHTNVKVTVPFRDGEAGELGLAVDSSVKKSEFHLQDSGIVVHDLSGKLSFDLVEGLSSAGVNGSIFDGPVSGTIKTVADEAGQQTIVRLQGETDLLSLKPWLKLDFLDPISGNLKYFADVYLRKEIEQSAIARSFVEIRSDLIDTSIDYPIPLYKPAGVALPFTYKASLGGAKHYQEIKLNEIFDLQLVSGDEGFERGGIGFGQQAEISDPGLFAINGSMSEFHLSEWLQVYEELEQRQRLRGSASANSSILTRLAESRLTIGKTLFNDQVINALTLTLKPESDGYFIEGDSSMFKGSVLLPTAYMVSNNIRGISAPIKVKLAELTLPESGGEGAAADASQETLLKESFNPAQLPALDLTIDRLKIGDGDFGSWNLVWKPVTAGVEIETLNFDLKHMNFEGGGRWLWQKDHATTELKGIVRSKNVSDVLTAWGYAPSLTSKAASASIEAYWPEAPYEFDLMTASANMNLVIKDGRFKDVSSGTADKVLGFLNFDDWLSRLQLKIKDLESNEMPYSEIRGQFSLNDKVLKTSTLKLDGAALKIAMNGELNLQSKQIDAGLDVTIPVTRNLVLPAAAVGGLPAAATVYVIEKVLGSQLDKLTTMKYTIKGDFGDPKVALKESFNIIPKQIQESIVKNGQGKAGAAVRTEDAVQGMQNGKPSIEKPANTEGKKVGDVLNSTSEESTVPATGPVPIPVGNSEKTDDRNSSSGHDATVDSGSLEAINGE